MYHWCGRAGLKVDVYCFACALRYTGPARAFLPATRTAVLRSEGTFRVEATVLSATPPDRVVLTLSLTSDRGGGSSSSSSSSDGQQQQHQRQQRRQAEDDVIPMPQSSDAGVQGQRGQMYVGVWEG
jgi:hypothetical protein